MLKYSLIALFFIFSVRASAQETDSLFAVHNGVAWAIKYTVQPNETKQMLTKRFYLPDIAIDAANSMDNAKRVTPGMAIVIPVISQNYFVTKPPPMDLLNIRELYYNVTQSDNIEMISTYCGITKSLLRTWNNLHGNTLRTGQVLFIGWVKMMAKDSTNAFYDLAYYVPRKKPVSDTNKVIVLGGLDTVYNRQTNNGLNVLSEKGTAVFFDKPGKNNVFYAFHNSTPRNSVIKVFNPGTGRTIYVKVLGPLPDTKLYANCIIGISGIAKEALGITENKAWCELTYATN